MDSDRMLTIVAVAAVVISIFAAGFTYFSIADLTAKVTGYGLVAQINLSIESAASVNWTTYLIDFGSGRVDQGETAASLTTMETNNVTGGNWTLLTPGGLQIENTGNVNVSLNISVDLNISEFIGGTGSVLEWNLTDVEPGSCTGAERNTTWYSANTTHYQDGGGIGCGVFFPDTAKDMVRIDFNITIPEDAITGGHSVNVSAAFLQVS